eukprot:INCI10140.3.p1 GENE.INCI10140.3~~INCI10140.3.p1  ORF type:complete len:494 (-),score=99.30 INCI10140.3:127-1608(-)
MKFFIAATIASVAMAEQALLVDLDDSSVSLPQRFSAFMDQFEKDYSSVDDRESAFRAFAANDAKIQLHNSKGLSFTLGHNQFSDLTSEEFNARFVGSYLNNPNLVRERNYDMSLADPTRVAAAPESIDWTTKDAVTPIKNQGQCGSCWAFSTVMALEGANAVEHSELKSLSEQDLVSCDHNGDQGCNGGLMDNAFTWVEENGICTEDSYPYTSGTGTTGECKTTCKPYLKIANFTDVPPKDEDALKVAVAQQPVAVAIEADKSVFQLYKSGVLKSDFCGTNLDHGVGIVGYGKSEDGFDYWKVKNSWGATWGMDGYILLERGTNECGISQQASFPTGVHKLTEERVETSLRESMELSTVRSVRTRDPDPPQPDQPADFLIYVSNFCNSTATLSDQDRNLWEGTFAVDPPDTVASEMSGHFKYGFEVVADPATARINGTLVYEDPFVFIDFFAVEHEWGVQVEFQPAIANVVVSQADIGNLSVYDIIVGFNQTC